MDINVLDIKGQETGRKVTLNENILLSLTTTSFTSTLSSILLISAREQLNRKREVSTLALHVSSVVRKAAAVHVVVISTHRCSLVVDVSSARSHATIASN